MDSLAVATENMSRRQACEEAGRPEAEDWMHADGLARSGEVPRAPERVRHDEHTPLGLPEGDLLPEAVPDDPHETAARFEAVELHPQVGNAKASGEGHGVALVSIQELDDRLGLA